MRRAEDLCASAEKRWSARYTGFLSDREQDLCAAALNRVGCDWYRFDGGYDGAERKLLCLAPFGIECEPPIRFVKVAYSHLCAQPPAHRDCLGAILGLAVERSCIGDLIPSPDEHCIYVAVLQEMAGVLAGNFGRQAGFRCAPPCAKKGRPFFRCGRRRSCRRRVWPHCAWMPFWRRF